MSRLAGRVSFFVEVATFQITPSGAWTTPPYPHSDLAAGFSQVAPAATAAPRSRSASAGWATRTERVKPRKPVVGASDARTPIRSWTPNASARKRLDAAGSGVWSVSELRESVRVVMWLTLGTEPGRGRFLET